MNYIWAQFFGRGIVDPPDQFDPARLDPDNPPDAPWTLQPSNPRLLNAMAQRFVDTGYDLKMLMRDVANSQAYQLASEYNGQWNPDWENSPRAIRTAFRSVSSGIAKFLRAKTPTANTDFEAAARLHLQRTLQNATGDQI